MKNFFQFLSESTAVQQATRMGLVSDGHGGWYDKKGEFVAKTEKGQLKFYNKRQRIGQQDPAQTDKEKRLSQTSYETQPAQEPATQQQGAAPQQEPQAEKPEMVQAEVFGILADFRALAGIQLLQAAVSALLSLNAPGMLKCRFLQFLPNP